MEKEKNVIPGLGDVEATSDAGADIALFEGLTKTEKRVAIYMIHGKSRLETAAALGLSDNTIKTHVQNILRKTGVKSQKEFMAKYLL